MPARVERALYIQRSPIPRRQDASRVPWSVPCRLTSVRRFRHPSGPCFRGGRPAEIALSALDQVPTSVEGGEAAASSASRAFHDTFAWLLDLKGEARARVRGGDCFERGFEDGCLAGVSTASFL
ncbi:hypothetical protein MTO96_008595 [Rhipicephalus appendiculatus]